MDPDKKIHLKRNMSLFTAVAIVVGSVIGSGIFISVRGVLAGTQSVGLCLTVWLVCGIVTLLQNLCFAELGTFFRKSGSIYIFILEIYGRYIGFVLGITTQFFLVPSATTVTTLTAAKYIAAPIFERCGAGEIFIKVASCLLLLTCGMANSISTKASLAGVKFFFVLKLIGSAVVIVGGIVTLTKGNTEGMSGGFSGSTSNPGDIISAYFSASWAFSGGIALTNVTEELKNPNKNLARATIIGHIIIIILYLAIVTSYFLALGPEGMMATDAVGVTFEKEVLHTSFILSICVAASASGSVFSTIFLGSRLTYVMAREGQLPEVLSFVHISQKSPYIAVVFKTLFSFILIFLGDITELINFISILYSIFGVLAMIGLIIVRFRRKDEPGPYKVPLVIPILIVFVNLGLVIVPLVFTPRLEYLLALALIPLATIFYIPFVYFRLSLPYINKITIWIQLLIKVAPSGQNTDE